MYPKLPEPMPPLNSPEYVDLARQVAVQMGQAQKAPRTFSLAERRKAEKKYQRLLNRILQEIDKKLAACADPALIPSAMQGIINSPQFTSLCAEAARQMVTMLAVGQKSSWREAAKASSQGRRIYKALMNELASTSIGPAIASTVQQNAALIKTVPQTLARRFTALAEKRRFEGVRPEEIMQEIQAKAPHLREFEARRIARTESAKASTALIQARSESLGLDFYTWLSVEDERVRDAHRAMDGIICRWSDPPNPEALFGGHDSGAPYHPGCIYNCRCRARPVLALEDIKFPAKVHVAGRIVTVKTLSAFRKLFNLPDEKGG